MKLKIDIKKITVISVLFAMSYLCTFLLHFDLMFLKFDFKDAIIAISALIYGPLAGMFSSGIVALLEFITYSDTGVYGLIMNFLSSVAFSCVGGFIYKYRRTFQGAIFSGLSSILAVTAVMIFANMFITPYYMGVPQSEVIILIPKVLLPFNLIKSTVNASLLLLIYKPVTKAFGRMGLMPKKSYGQGTSLRTIILIISCLAVATVSVLLFVFVLNGSVGI